MSLTAVKLITYLRILLTSSVTLTSAPDSSSSSTTPLLLALTDCCNGVCRYWNECYIIWLMALLVITIIVWWLTSVINSSIVYLVFFCANFLPHHTNWHPPLTEEKKEEIWLSPMTKAPTPAEMSKGQSDNTNNATTSSITQRLWTDF